MIQSFRTDRPRQTVQTQIRLDLGGSALFAIPSPSSGHISQWKAMLLKFKDDNSSFRVSKSLGFLWYVRSHYPAG